MTPFAWSSPLGVVRATSEEKRIRNVLQIVSGGETGIRTLGRLAPTTVFETAPFDHSGTSPSGSAVLIGKKRLRKSESGWFLTIPSAALDNAAEAPYQVQQIYDQG